MSGVNLLYAGLQPILTAKRESCAFTGLSAWRHEGAESGSGPSL